MNIKKTIKSIFSKVGLQITRISPNGHVDRSKLSGSLQTAKAIGFAPRTIIDVGAAQGGWSLEVSSTYNDAVYLLIEPLAENVPMLQKACQKIGNADYLLAAACAKAGTVPINVHQDLNGSSLFGEREADINGTSRVVQAIILDRLAKKRSLNGPFLLKMDVQGAEMEVLRGSDNVLRLTEMLVLEVLLFDIFQGNNPQLFDIVAYLKSKGFVAWDMFGMGYRPLDQALCQVDMVFVKENGLFRRIHQYATEEQRRGNTKAPEKRSDQHGLSTKK